jgi:hypothetical protein
MELPIRIEFFGDEIDSLRAFDPTDQRTTGLVEHATLLPASEFLLPASGAADIRGRLGRAAKRLSERLAGDLARFEGTTDDPLRPSARPADVPGQVAKGSRALTVGDAAEVWAPYLAPSTALDHIDPGALLVIDEPGDVAEAAGFLWRQADERRAELVEAAELPKDWQSTYLPARDWKARLVASRTLELTWESEPPADVAMAGGAADRGISSDGASPHCRSAAPAGCRMRSRRGARTAPASCSPRTRRRALPRSSRTPGTPRRSSTASTPHRRPARSRSSAEPERWLLRWPGRADVRDRSRAVRDGPRPPPEGAPTCRPARHPRAADARRTSSSTSTTASLATSRCSARWGRARSATYLELSFAGDDRIFVPVEQIGAVTRYCGRERPAL